MSQTSENTPRTLDQKRAAFAWECAVGAAGLGKQYGSLAKGAPALIMNSGLMPALAFYHDKGGAALRLLDDLVRGLSLRLHGQELKVDQGAAAFKPFMQMLQACDARTYLRHTDEALELLKWIRQFVSAVEPAGAR